MIYKNFKNIVIFSIVLLGFQNIFSAAAGQDHQHCVIVVGNPIDCKSPSNIKMYFQNEADALGCVHEHEVSLRFRKYAIIHTVSNLQTASLNCKLTETYNVLFSTFIRGLPEEIDLRIELLQRFMNSL